MINIVSAPQILIGNKFLMQYGKIAINWKQKKMLFEKKNEHKIVEDEKTFGFTPNLIEDKLIVSFIWENTDKKRNVRKNNAATRKNNV
jgi:uncharacterized membrane protein (Fun14 family)